MQVPSLSYSPLFQRTPHQPIIARAKMAVLANRPVPQNADAPKIDFGFLKGQLAIAPVVAEGDAAPVSAPDTRCADALGVVMRNADLGLAVKTVGVMLQLGQTASSGIYDGEHPTAKGMVIASLVLFGLENQVRITESLTRVADNTQKILGYFRDVQAFEHKLNTPILEHGACTPGQFKNEMAGYDGFAEFAKLGGVSALTAALVTNNPVIGGCFAIAASTVFLAVKEQLSDKLVQLANRFKRDADKIIETQDSVLTPLKRGGLGQRK